MITLSSLVADEDKGSILDVLTTNSLSSIMVTVAKDDTPIVFVNDAFTRLTGYAADEVVGKSPRLLQGPKTDPEVLGRLREDLSAGRVFEGRTVNYRSDCSEFVMHWKVFGIGDHGGQPTHFVAIQQEARDGGE